MKKLSEIIVNPWIMNTVHVFSLEVMEKNLKEF